MHLDCRGRPPPRDEGCPPKSGPRDGYDPEEYDGNHLLHFLMGANIRVVRPENSRGATEEIMERLRTEGHRPYHMVVGGFTPI